MKIVEILDKNSKPKLFIPVFILGFILQGIMLAVINPKILALTGGLAPLDLQMGYTTDYAIQFLDALGQQGRDIFIHQFVFTDWFYTLISGVAWTLLLSWLYKKAFPSKSTLLKLGMIPIFVTVFDYLENIFSVIMVINYPEVTPTLSSLGSASGVIKMIFFGLTLLQILFLVMVVIKNRIVK